MTRQSCCSASWMVVAPAGWPWRQRNASGHKRSAREMLQEKVSPEIPSAVCASVYAERRASSLDRRGWASAVADWLSKNRLSIDRISGARSIVARRTTLAQVIAKASVASDFNMYSGRCDHCPSNLDMLDWQAQAGFEGKAAQLRLSVNTRLEVSPEELMLDLLEIAQKAHFDVYAGFSLIREYSRGPNLFQLGQDFR